MTSCLLSTEHVLSKASAEAGKDYEQQVKDHKKAKEAYQEALANADLDRLWADLDDLPRPPAELAPPHLHIALTAINAALEARQGETAAVKQARQDLLAAWNSEVEWKSQVDKLNAVKIWNCRKPTAKQMKRGANCKLLFCVKHELDQPLRNYLAATGAKNRADHVRPLLPKQGQQRG